MLLVDKEKPVFPEPVRTVIDSTLPRLTDGGKSPDELNQLFIAKHYRSLDHLIACKYLITSATPFLINYFSAAQVLYQLHPELRDKAVAMVTDLSDQLTDMSLKVRRFYN